jgi:hypothetical protein
MPPQAPAPTPIPTGQANPMLMAVLRARAMQGARGVPNAMPAPNGLPLPGAPIPPVPPAAAGGLPRPVGAGTPSQQVMKAAAQAQSPMQDPETRASAKDLILKLMKHM